MPEKQCDYLKSIYLPLHLSTVNNFSMVSRQNLMHTTQCGLKLQSQLQLSSDTGMATEGRNWHGEDSVAPSKFETCHSSPDKLASGSYY